MVRGGTASGGKKTKERRKDTISSACSSPRVRAQSSGQVLRSYRCRWNPRARAELDYTAKGYIYRARMYAEARTSPQRDRGFSLDATSRVDSHKDSEPRRRIGQTPRNGLPNFPLLAPSFLIPLRRLLPLSLPRGWREFTLSIHFIEVTPSGMRYSPRHKFAMRNVHFYCL